ncbi:MAG: hypothetical protein KC684_08875 [Candidatus Omnitrophica bacterium]|nr:hypothetical protein [Candidatus Omnitrophota bacterium]
MEESYWILKKAIEPVGAKQVASKLNISQSLVYKWCQKPDSAEEIASGAANPLDRLKKIYEITGDVEIVRWVCQMANGYFVANLLDDKKPIDVNVLKNIQIFIKEFSEALGAISSSYNVEKRITKDEAAVIRKEWEDLKSVGERFVKACEEGKFI